MTGLGRWDWGSCEYCSKCRSHSIILNSIAGNISKCAVCGNKYNKPVLPPHDICIKHREWRTFTPGGIPQSNAYHVNLPCIHHKWPLFTPYELIITPEVYEKLGQQHYDHFYSNIWMLHLNLHCAHATLFIAASFNACCPIIIVLWSAGANVHSRLNVWACTKTMILVQSTVPVQSSPIQRLYTAFIACE